MNRNNLVKAGMILAGLAAGAGLGLFLIRRRQANIDDMSGDGQLLGEADEVVVLIEPETTKSQSLLGL